MASFVSSASSLRLGARVPIPRSVSVLSGPATATHGRRRFGSVHDAPPLHNNPAPPPTAPRIPATATATAALRQALEASGPRTGWTKEEISHIYNTPLFELQHAAATVHRRFHAPGAIQLCTLMNIKTGGCSEDCSYCAQSSRYQTGLQAQKMATVEAVLAAARVAREKGASRFCMGAAWRDMRGRKTSLRNVKAMVQGVRDLGMEACVTLGMIDAAQARELKDAGLTAYNHNVDTSREHYPNVITTRTYDERLETIDNVRRAGINVCSGGILGLGEAPHDRVGLIHTVATMPAHPESFPVNALVPIKGTPLGGEAPVPFDAIVRTIATARLVLPATIIRLAAGRNTMSEEKQMLCFAAGANAVFTGEKMLTTDCNGWDQDREMFERWGLRPMAAQHEAAAVSAAPNNKVDELTAASWQEIKNQASTAAVA